MHKSSMRTCYQQVPKPMRAYPQRVENLGRSVEISGKPHEIAMFKALYVATPRSIFLCWASASSKIGWLRRSTSVALSTKAHCWDDVVVLRCVGRLVAGSETITFRQRVEKLLSERRKVVINFTEVDHTDSTGLATLAYFSKRNKQNRDPESGTRLASSRIYLLDLLRRTKLDTVITVYPNEEDAIASFPKQRLPTQLNG